MLGRYEPFEVFRNQSLLKSNVNTFTTQFPVGKPWHYLDLLFEFKVTGGVAAAVGPVADGILAILKSVNCWSPRNEYFFQNVPGRLAYPITMEAFSWGAPRLDTVPADPGNGSTSAIFGALVRIPFHDPNVFDPSDFILDTLGYSNMNLSIQLGAEADLYGTVNNVSISTAQVTAVLWQEPTPLVYQAPKTAGAQAKKQGQVGKWYLSHLVAGALDPTTNSFMDLPRSADMAYMNLWAFHGQTAVSGQPFSGATDNIGTRYTDLTLQTDTSFPIKSVRTDYLRDWYQAQFAGFSAQFKQNSYLSVRWPSRGQKQAAQYSGDKSMLRLGWTLPSSGAATAGSMLSVGAKVWRLKAQQ
jgi:hypothetical protein